jgi:hypothetical protein
MEAKLYSFYDVLDIVSIPENEIGNDLSKHVSDMHLAAVTYAVAKSYLPLGQATQVLEELMAEFSETEWNTIEFMASINVSMGEPRSSVKKALAEATEKSAYDGTYGFVAVPVHQKFPNGDHKILSVLFEKTSRLGVKDSKKTDGTLN